MTEIQKQYEPLYKSIEALKDVKKQVMKSFHEVYGKNADIESFPRFEEVITMIENAMISLGEEYGGAIAKHINWED